ncbi:hypothetical protein Vadar_031486 [Vaccinium darrowii]|uniref:Uncharacterized protein n=1 Tax=Vaccinium darrowii TaxID=229202 RepID=A0ACB7XE62_9ERIC|nr:hypothetical protein Vadar_031486 [Vaccinium darrowii]
MSAESTYVDKTRKNETADLWHARLGHVSYHKLKIMMKKAMLKDLPQLDVREDVICAGCQYGKAHQLPLPKAKLGFVSPYEKLWSTPPIVSHFRVFGCVCYVFVPDHLRSKFDKKAIRCIFVGYSGERKGWKCCDPTTGRCYTSRNVVFDEASSWWSPQKVELPNSGGLEDLLQEKLGEIKEGEESPDSLKESTPTIGDSEQEPSSSGTPEKPMSPWQTGVHPSSPEEIRPSQQEVEEDNPPPRRFTRQRKPNPKYMDAALAKEEIEESHVKTKNQVVDNFTEGLSNFKLSKFRKQLGIKSKAELRETMDVFAVGVGKGKLRCLLFDPETVADMIPGDMVVNSMLVAIAVNANQYRQIMIYHVGSSLRNPLRYPSIQLYVFRYFTKNPWIDRRGGNPVKVDKLRVFSNMASYQKYVTIHYLMPLKVMKLLNVALCHYLQGTYIAQERKIKFLFRLVELYMPYLFSRAIFDDSNTEKLRMEAREAGGDGGVFNFDPKIIDWEEYFMNIHFPGVVKYLF